MKFRLLEELGKKDSFHQSTLYGISKTEGREGERQIGRKKRGTRSNRRVGRKSRNFDVYPRCGTSDNRIVVREGEGERGFVSSGGNQSGGEKRGGEHRGRGIGQ